jgi:hypothetical protein
MSKGRRHYFAVLVQWIQGAILKVCNRLASALTALTNKPVRISYGTTERTTTCGLHQERRFAKATRPTEISNFKINRQDQRSQNVYISTRNKYFVCHNCKVRIRRTSWNRKKSLANVTVIKIYSEWCSSPTLLAGPSAPPSDCDRAEKLSFEMTRPLSHG